MNLVEEIGRGDRRRAAPAGEGLPGQECVVDGYGSVVVVAPVLVVGSTRP